MEGRFVAYYRVSTAQQGRSGLGLEAQEKAVTDQLNGGHWQLVGSFTEIESGANDDRPQLKAALDLCQDTGSTLLIAKLDRLSRDAHFLLGLQKAGVKFCACDMPEANAFTVGILALVAQHEREAISSRTKAALQAAKARGQKLGTAGAANLAAKPEAVKAGRRKGTIVRTKAADEFAARTRQRIDAIQRVAVSPLSLRNIASSLESQGILTARGGKTWTAAAVSRIQKR